MILNTKYKPIIPTFINHIRVSSKNRWLKILTMLNYYLLILIHCFYSLNYACSKPIKINFNLWHDIYFIVYYMLYNSIFVLVSPRVSLLCISYLEFGIFLWPLNILLWIMMHFIVMFVLHKSYCLIIVS